MNIVVKLGEHNFSLNKNLRECIESKIEIQMLTKDLLKSLSNCRKVLEHVTSFTELDEVVLHLPFSLHTWDIYVASSILQDDLKKFIDVVKEMSYKYDIKVGILFHQESSLELIETVSGYGVIHDILNYCDSDRVYFLVENCLPCLNQSDVYTLPAFELIEKVNHPKMLCCLDVCHMRCYENILGTSLVVPSSIADSVRWVHFSDTIMNDGYKDKKTHGVAHNHLYRALRDIALLLECGVSVSEVGLVTEVWESDFQVCENTIQEVDILRTIRDKYSSFCVV